MLNVPHTSNKPIGKWPGDLFNVVAYFDLAASQVDSLGPIVQMALEVTKSEILLYLCWFV